MRLAGWKNYLGCQILYRSWDYSKKRRHCFKIFLLFSEAATDRMSLNAFAASAVDAVGSELSGGRKHQTKAVFMVDRIVSFGV